MENWALAFVTVLEYPSSPLLNRAVCHLNLRKKNNWLEGQDLRAQVFQPRIADQSGTHIFIFRLLLVSF